MERVQRNAARMEPFRDFAHVLLAISVVEVLARRENLDGLRSRANEFVEQAGCSLSFT